jgi:myo-inositol 2-dehydrogenase / D-chiro-inositol 1-dehydrogenase
MSETNTNSSPSNITRRTFLGSASKIAAGGVLLGALPVERFAHGAASGTLRLALIGCGGRGSGAANQALTTGHCRLVAMADAFGDQLQSSLANLRAAHPDAVDVPSGRRYVGFDAYRAATDDADVVVLGAPPGFRPLHYEYAVAQSKHIFMEKPVATDGLGIRKMLAAADIAKQKNLKIVVGLQRRYEPGYIEIIKRIHDGEIGDVVAMRCYWNDAGVWVKPRQPNQTEMEYQMRNWYYFVWLSGDHIVEQHVHNIDVCNWVKGAYPRRAQGMGGREVRTGKEYGEIFDHHAVEFEYPDGVRMFSFCRHMRNTWSNVSEHVVGTKGLAEVSKPHVLKDHKGKILWRYRPEKAVDPYQQEHDDLFDAILNDKPHDDSDYGIRSTLSGIQGRLATYSGQQVMTEDVLESEIDLFPERLAWDATPKLLPGPDGFYPVAIPGVTEVV